MMSKSTAVATAKEQEIVQAPATEAAAIIGLMVKPLVGGRLDRLTAARAESDAVTLTFGRLAPEFAREIDDAGP